MKKALSIRELKERLPRDLREDFDKKTEKSYETIRQLDELWEHFELGISDTFSLGNWYAYTSARVNIFYWASRAARAIGERETGEYFISRYLMHEYDDYFYENMSDEGVIRVIGISKRLETGEIIIHLEEDIKPKNDPDGV